MYMYKAFAKQKLLILFLFLHQNLCFEYSAEGLKYGTFSEYQKSMFSWG